MENDSNSFSLWRRLFERRRIRSGSSPVTLQLPYLVILFGKRRQELTTEHLQEFEDSHSDKSRILEEDETSTKSFQTCVSAFENESCHGYDINNTIIKDTVFGHYISKSRLGKIAYECLELMKNHLSSCQLSNEDSTDKYLAPGIGWKIREDEEGPDVLDPEYFQGMNGLWKSVHDRSDDTVLMIDLMEMPWLFKKASKLLQYTEAASTKEVIGLYPKVLGLTFPTISYWTREGKMMPRRDMRKGIARITTVPTTFGFRQYLQWGEPYAGLAVAEGQLSSDFNNFEIVTWMQRYDGKYSVLRSRTARVKK